MYDAKILAHSISPAGVEVMTAVLTYWRMIHAEVWTYRSLWKTQSESIFEYLDASRSSSSSRAVSTERILAQVLGDPYIPIGMAKNTKNMVAGDEFDPLALEEFRHEWLKTRDDMVTHYNEMTRLGVHKQWKNRLLEPWQVITTVATGNRQWWDGYLLYQRCHPAAQPDFRVVAELLQTELDKSEPRLLGLGEWHLPYVSLDEMSTLVNPVETGRRLSSARCARASYFRAGESISVRDDLQIARDLAQAVPPHAAPWEHQLTPAPDGNERHGVYVGWVPQREFVFGGY